MQADLQGAIALPHRILHGEPMTHMALPILVAVFVAYVPVPFSNGAEPSSPAATLKTPKDWTIHLLTVVSLQFFALHPMPSAIDMLVLLPLVLVSIYFTRPPTASASASAKTRPAPATAFQTPRSFSPYQIIPQAWRPHLQTILHTDASRKIFYFLLINLAYMGVQMAYGVMTNSLGLISDGELPDSRIFWGS